MSLPNELLKMVKHAQRTSQNTRLTHDSKHREFLGADFHRDVDERSEHGERLRAAFERPGDGRPRHLAARDLAAAARATL